MGIKIKMGGEMVEIITPFEYDGKGRKTAKARKADGTIITVKLKG